MSDDNEGINVIKMDIIPYITRAKKLSNEIQRNLVELNRQILEIENIVRDELAFAETNSAQSHDHDCGDETAQTEEMLMPPRSPPISDRPSVKDFYGKDIYVGTRVICLTKGKYKCNTGEVYGVNKGKNQVLIDLDDENKTKRKGNHVRIL